MPLTTDESSAVSADRFLKLNAAKCKKNVNAGNEKLRKKSNVVMLMLGLHIIIESKRTKKVSGKKTETFISNFHREGELPL